MQFLTINEVLRVLEGVQDEFEPQTAGQKRVMANVDNIKDRLLVMRDRMDKDRSIPDSPQDLEDNISTKN